MMKKLFYLFFILSSLFSLLLTSCEWNGDDDDNYVEIEKPQENFDFKVDLAGVNPEEVIQIVNGSWLSYTLYTGGHDLITQTYYLDGKELSNYSWNSIYIDGFAQDGKIHELKVVMTLKTNTGSLAEMLQAEFYVGEYTFKIKLIEKDRQYDFNINQSLSENKYLKLNWSGLQGIDIDRYELYIDNRQAPEVTITNLNDTYFIDKTYYYGYRLYTIKAYPKNSLNIQPIEAHHYAQYNVFTDEYVKNEMTSKSIKITWNNPNPYPVEYAFSHYDQIYTKKSENNSIDIPRRIFPINDQDNTIKVGFLYLLPVNSEIENFEDYYQYPYVFYRNFEDKQVTSDKLSWQFYDFEAKKIIAYGFDSYIIDPFNEMRFIKKEINPDLWNSVSSYSNTKKGKIAFSTRGNNMTKIYLFKDSELSKIENTFQVESNVNKFSISDTNLFYIQNDTLCAVDIDTRLILDKKKLDMNEWNEVTLKVSDSGKYLVVYTNSYNKEWYELYELKNNRLNLLKRENKGFWHIYFDPLDESKILLEYGEGYYIMDISTLKIIKTVHNKYYLYTDPITNNKLYIESNNQEDKLFLTVYNTDSKQIYKIETLSIRSYMNAWILVNNIIYYNGFSGNYYMDISDSINQK